MRLYDTMSRGLRELKPIDGETYRFYCCGPTVYGPAHIGNFRTFVLQDVFRRTLEASRMAVLHVRNLTDVDDKTIRDSQADGLPLGEFTAKWRDRFHADCAALNLRTPHIEPSAVEHIPHQIAMIEELMAKGHAYRSDDGSVYYRVASFDGYGRLSRLESRELRAGASGAVQDDEYAKDAAADFALWKAWRPEDGDNAWESPWGKGRPGWHLECSAMCREYLGDQFDLHSGGVDLVFPHHENEIAQSEACTGCRMAEHWFHLTHLLVDGGKMSKSLGNFYTLEDLSKAGFSPAELRYVLISAHYRQPLNFVARDDRGEESFPALAAARSALARIAKFAAALAEQGQVEDLTGFLAAADRVEPGAEDTADDADTVDDAGASAFDAAFEALLEDLNTPDALGRAFSAMKSMKPAALSPDDARRELAGLARVLSALGLELPEVATAGAEAAPAEVAALAEARFAAKAEKNWAEADRLRDQIHAAGWEVKDSREGYELCRPS
jgi:cysteinyl-tRNA synthetase